MTVSRAGGAAAAISMAALVWSAVAGAAPVLHEWLPPPGERQHWARDGQLPDSILAGDRKLPRPSETRSAADHEPVHGRRAMDRQTRVDPDRTTTHDGTLRYAAEFNPSVVPFKRGGALDAVATDFTLGLARPALAPLALARRPAPPDHDAFWGSMVVQLHRGVAVPIPSVAAGAAIVSYRATPPLRLEFLRDSADNVWVRANHTGRIRLVFLTDAARSYFAPEVPPLVTTALVPPALRPRVPANVSRQAAKVHQHIGVRSGQTLYRQLERMVTYFRNFEAAPLERDSGNTYLDIALSQRGVCRHRSYAFVITALALGIPARYVHNEAHAFTEVYVPRLGWIRVDLGGASTELQVNNARKKAVHDAGPDPFPRPSRFSANYSQLGRRVTGLRPGQRQPRRTTTDLRRFRQRHGTTGGGGSGAGGSGAGGSTAGGPLSAAGAGARVAGADEGADGRANAAAQEAARQPTAITVETSVPVVRRGEALRVWGRVTAGGAAVPGLRVELYVSRDGASAEAMLGAAVTNPRGEYDVRLSVPLQLAVGDYRVFAATPGDDRHAPGLSR